MPHPIPSTDQPPIDRLREIMHLLRKPGGCPWDAEQTHESLLPHLIEEAYEAAEAIRGGHRDEIVDELGDLLLQPVFHAEIASETSNFDFDDIATAICEKLIRRHPHVFGDSPADTPDAVLSQWESIKRQEKNRGPNPVESPTQQGYVVEKVDSGLPALMAAQKLQKRVAKVGFDWTEMEPVLDKVREETAEVAEALTQGNPEAIAEEIGDLLFAAVNLSRKAGYNAELLLSETNRKFLQRFQKTEDILREQQKSMKEATLPEMDAAWEQAKQNQRIDH